MSAAQAVAGQAGTARRPRQVSPGSYVLAEEGEKWSPPVPDGETETDLLASLLASPAAARATRTGEHVPREHEEEGG